MKTIQTQININASINQVWKTLMNFEKYPEWNPFIQSISGNPKTGEKLTVSIHPPEKSAMIFTPKVLVCTDKQEFRWKGKLGIKGIFDGEHYFILQAISNNKTELIHGENFTGLLSNPINKMLKDSTTKGFELMNQSLKQRVENQ